MILTGLLMGLSIGLVVQTRGWPVGRLVGTAAAGTAAVVLLGMCRKFFCIRWCQDFVKHCGGMCG